MADTVDLVLYDVFTDTPFSGNPLAVAIEPPSLSDLQHQRIANELNLSETVFLRRRDDRSWDARIFTPTAELPFAGHPTVGAAIALAESGLGDDRIVLHEGVGPVEVALRDRTATLTTPTPPRDVEVADPSDVVAAVGLTLTDLHPELGPRGWSVGVPFTIVAVRDVDTLGQASVDAARWGEGVGLTSAPDLYVVAPLDGLDGERWRARMFAPTMGIAEDPATGSAAAATCGFLAGHVRPARLEQGWVFEQGVEMGRPSTIHLGAVVSNDELVAVTVGGGAVQVGRAELSVPV